MAIEERKPKSFLEQILEQSKTQDDKFLAVHKANNTVLVAILDEVSAIRESLKEIKEMLRK